MNFHELVSKVLSKMKESRKIFSSSSNPEEKKRVYNEFVDGITSLNKILKGGNFGEGSKNKIREILKSSIQQAGEMKGALANLKSGGGPSGGNGGGRGTNLSNNNSSKLFFRILHKVDLQNCGIWAGLI